MKKKFSKIVTILLTILMVFILTSASSISINLKLISKSDNVDIIKLNNNPNEVVQKTEIDSSFYVKNDIEQSFPIETFGEKMYGYNAYPGPEGTIWFDIDDPGTIYELGETVSGDFLTGGTYACDDIWYAVQYGNGLLYGIDPDTGDMWAIGGGGVGITALAYDYINNRMYGTTCNYLYEIDPETGEQEQIGPLTRDPLCMIGLAFDSQGILYGWDQGDYLWIIDPEAGEATEVGPLGINVTGYDSGDFSKSDDNLYLIASGHLYSCDKYTAGCTLIGDFEEEIEITACMIEFYWGPEKDIGLYSIDSPDTGYAGSDMPMQVTVKNFGNTTLTTDVQMIVDKYNVGSVIFDEDFSGLFPPEGWETDFWNKSYTNNAGGNAPEAQVYKYDQYNESQYYDNYITSALIDCTNVDKVNVKFNWGADYDYPQYCNVYVKFRGNSSSPWKDVTPWGNPVGHDQDGGVYEVNCYGIDEPFGTNFQIKWEYIGYYSYFKYLWLDDIIMTAYNTTNEYNEIVEDIEVELGEEVIVNFPNWTPSDWNNPAFQNSWQDYIIQACTLLYDQKPQNDCKIKTIDLYYPWFHDVELKSIDSPCEDGPGKTYPVQATIKNVGQVAECCIPINISIGTSLILETLLEESTWPNDYPEVPADGWTDEHKEIAYYYGWRRSSTYYSGGTSPEAYIPYYYCNPEYHFYSYAIDTSDYQMLNLQFLTCINHYSGEGMYALEAGYSTDGENWYTVWHEEPSASRIYEVDVAIEGGSENLYIGFWVTGNPFYFNYWYIDNVKLVALGFFEEYYDFACQGPDIEPGEEVTFTFEDWTPDFLGEETTDSKEYIVKSHIKMEGDNNSGNDIKSEQFTLNYWHDVGIDEVISPVPRIEYEKLWDNGDPDGRSALQGSMYQGYNNILIDDFQNYEDWLISGGLIHLIWDSGYENNTETIRVYFFNEEYDCFPSFDEYPQPDYVFEATKFNEYTTGKYYFDRPEVIVEFLLEEDAQIIPGKWYIGIQLEGIIDDIAYTLTAPDNGCMVMADLPYWGYPRWTSSEDIWDSAYDLAWELHWVGYLPINSWIQPSLQDIDIIVMNYGTFPKENLTCYAEIIEYITDPNGTIVYTDQIDGIDLTTPLGGSKVLQFDDFEFTKEGHYRLYLNFPATPDDIQKNNKKQWRIAVDDTEPISEYPPMLDPPQPDGKNGWYISDVKVTINASDPWSNGVSSGVKEIRYRVNGGIEQVLEGNQGGFVLREDGEDILIEYWAVDWVGNVETPKNSFTVDIDQTEPEISLSYEVTGGNPITGWKLNFFAGATDDTSGMGYVEFYFNDVFQEKVTGPGPIYEWTFTYYGDISVIITAIAYDIAGNLNSDKIVDPTICTYNKPKSNEFHSSNSHILQIPKIR